MGRYTVRIMIEGGCTMEYKIEKWVTQELLVHAREFHAETSEREIPKFNVVIFGGYTMIRPIMKDPIFLAQRSASATVTDLPVAQDLRDTLAAHRDSCAGMAVNMIGAAKRVIIFDDNDSATVMFNPEIVK